MLSTAAPPSQSSALLLFLELEDSQLGMSSYKWAASVINVPLSRDRDPGSAPSGNGAIHSPAAEEHVPILYLPLLFPRHKEEVCCGAHHRNNDSQLTAALPGVSAAAVAAGVLPPQPDTRVSPNPISAR
ncbi:unnamed protein product [Arctogadus glacialis]